MVKNNKFPINDKKIANKFRFFIIEVIKILLGISFLLIVGLIAKYIGSFIPHVSYLVIAIGLGLLISNYLKLPEFIDKGINKTHKLLLETGIVVLGAGILFVNLIEVGPKLLVTMIFTVVFSLTLVEFISSRFSLEPKLGSCLASGTSVCGVSAIIATGGAIGATQKQIAVAIATILIFDVVTVFSYPLIGRLFLIPSQVYGPWAGLSMFSTGTAVAAGFAHSVAAGQLATVAKMARNVFIGVWALAYTLYYIRKGSTNINIKSKPKYLWKKFPKFVIGFIALMIIGNTGILSAEQIGSLKNAYNWLFMLAFVGLGYSIRIKELRETGFKPVTVILISFSITSLLVLTFSYIFFR